jgi:hypothetical protein
LRPLIVDLLFPTVSNIWVIRRRRPGIFFADISRIGMLLIVGLFEIRVRFGGPVGPSLSLLGRASPVEDFATEDLIRWYERMSIQRVHSTAVPLPKLNPQRSCP